MSPINKNMNPPRMRGNLLKSSVCFKNPIDETYGAYGTSPNTPAMIVKRPVRVNEFRYSASVASVLYNTSVPLRAPNVFAVFSNPVMTAVNIILVFQNGFPKGNNYTCKEHEPPVEDSLDPMAIIYIIQPTKITINRLYRRIPGGDFTLIMMTITAIMTDTSDIDK